MTDNFNVSWPKFVRKQIFIPKRLDSMFGRALVPCSSHSVKPDERKTLKAWGMGPLTTEWLLWMTSNRHILGSLSILGFDFCHAGSIVGCLHFR